MKNWKKGALHTHTLWSDGRSLPEMALKCFKERGYDFVCLSDHNIFQEDKNVWNELHPAEGGWPPFLSAEEYRRTVAEVPVKPDEKDISVKKYVRLKTWQELKDEWEIPGKFLVIPGEEITIMGASFDEEIRRYHLHVNVFNIAKYFPVPEGGTAQKLMEKIFDMYNPAAKDSFLMLNHPFWRVWDVDPRLLIENPEIHIYEICNSGTTDMPDGWIYDREQYWDFVLAHRLANGDGLLYGTASDDAHYYDPPRNGKAGSCETGWVMVNCPETFTPAAISRAILAGDFYATCGVLLKDISFDEKTGTMNVEVDPEDGVNYRIDFITTKKDFDRTMELKDFPHKTPEYCRTRPVIPQGIGATAKTVNGTKGAYTLQDDDLYVRALVTSDKKTTVTNAFYPRFTQAWVQPVQNKKISGN